jgi:hypothetical protein
MHKKDDKNSYFAGIFARKFCQEKQLTGFHLFDCSAALFKKNAMSAVGTPDINVDLNFLLAPCTFVCTCHISP